MDGLAAADSSVENNGQTTNRSFNDEDDFSDAPNSSTALKSLLKEIGSSSSASSSPLKSTENKNPASINNNIKIVDRFEANHSAGGTASINLSREAKP